MKVFGFQSIKEAQEARERCFRQIHSILDTELDILSKEERTIGRWLSLLGKDPMYTDSRLKLGQLEDLLIDAEKYISGMKESL